MRILLTNGHRNIGLRITRHLGAAGHRLIVADSRALAFGFRSRYADRFEPLPAPAAPEYADRLLALVRRLRPDVLLPLGGLAAVSARLPEFERETAVLAADAPAHRALADKANVYALCRQLDIPHSRVLATDPQTLARKLSGRGGGAPLAVLKPRQDHGAGQGVVFLSGPEAVASTWHGVAGQHGPLVATEFIAGPVDAQYTVQLLFDRDSELIEFFVLQKLRQWPAGAGNIAAAISVHQPELVGQMLPLFRKLRWRGPAEVEFKRDPRTGDACVIEINPRFSGTIGFPLSVGVDLPGAMLRASLGRAAPRALGPYYAAGRYYWNPWPYARSVAGDLCHPRRMGEGLRGLAMPFTRWPAGNPYVLSDPGALIGKVLWQLGASLRARPGASSGAAGSVHDD